MARRYKLAKRAEHEAETRRRIVDATIALHQAVGGLNTTISAIAAQAGVERATVYRHFPDERALLQACTGHYLAHNRPPQPEEWLQIEDAEARLRTALTQVYAYHRRTEAMSARAASDLLLLPILREVLAPLFAYWRQVRDVLAAPWPVTGAPPRRLAAAIGLAVSFQTWQALVREQGLDEAEAVALMVALVKCAARAAPG
jgi:AcrR family transcriptional regulator